MAHANVSNGILTIIASFSNGLDVLKKLRQSNKKGPTRTKAAKRSDEDALQLSRSLRHGPEEIGREYQAGSMRCDSERYAMGDGRSSQDTKLQQLTSNDSHRTELTSRDTTQTERRPGQHYRIVPRPRQQTWT
jgi:hypothetical protein